MSLPSRIDPLYFFGGLYAKLVCSECTSFLLFLFLDITDVWDKKRAAIECMEGQHHLWNYYTNVAQNRGNHFRRNSGGMAGGRPAEYAEAFETVYPVCKDEL